MNLIKGDMISSNTQVLSIAVEYSYWIKAIVTDNKLASIKPNQKVKIWSNNKSFSTFYNGVVEPGIYSYKSKKYIKVKIVDSADNEFDLNSGEHVYVFV
jgi:multidrug resistance efflux pump